MGVVTDVTVKGLTTAVTNISATGMSDTTGQAIVTAINNLSGAISPAASNVTFNNTGTGLSASDAQSAITEVNNKFGVTSSTPSLVPTLPSGNSLSCLVEQINNLVIVNISGYLNSSYVPSGSVTIFEGLPRINNTSQLFSISSKGRFRIYNDGNNAKVALLEVTNVNAFIGQCFVYTK